LGIFSEGEITEAVAAHRDYIARETLASTLEAEPLAESSYKESAAIEDMMVEVSLRKA
jgi:hypothetical protein